MNIVAVAALIIVAYGYFKYIERRSTFFPMKRIEYTPALVGLAYEEVAFRTTDGFLLNGWFVPSKNESPVVLFCHGNGGNISHRLEIIEVLHAIGLSVLIFDYRGYGKSEGAPSEAGTYKDASAAYEFIVKNKRGSDNPVVLYGESIGGAVAADLAGRVSASALIMEGTFTSALDVARMIYPFLPLKLLMSIKYDSLSKIAHVTIPKLIIHSIDDEIIPFEQGKRLYAAAPEPKDFLEMRGGHNYAVILEKERFSQGVAQFLKKYGIVR